MKKRRDSFFGLHFDFHANPSDGVQGRTLNEDDIRKICKEIKPDFIQIDCKGHPGWTSYPSKLGNAMPEFQRDTLELWRRVTREEGVALYMHYSGVFDRKYCAEHPEDAVTKADGTQSDTTTSTMGGYVDKLLIPQLIELAEYGADGVWVDGECWMADCDFSPKAIHAFQKETGIDLGGTLPATPEDQYYQEYREYHREMFRRYLRYYVDAVHAKYPNFQICSNWAFSDHMPERVCANVDFLSGDLNPANGFNSARYAGRALAQQEYPWDLMSWNFRNATGGKKGYAAKHPCQIMQEAAGVISLGGAYQNYIVQKRDGSPNMNEIKMMGEVSEFVRKRKDFCFRGKIVHQAALLLSTYDRAREAKGLYSRTGFERVMGACALLCDVGHSLEIVCEHTLERYINEYKMIVVPELAFGLDKKTIDMLLEYAKNGGALVLLGKRTCALFADCSHAFSVVEIDETEKTEVKESYNGHKSEYTKTYKPYLFTIDKEEYGALFSPCSIDARDGKILSYVNERNKEKYDPVSVFIPFGSGSITAIGFDIGEQYLNSTQYMQRKLIKQATAGLYDPIARIESAVGRVEIVDLEKDGVLMLQLINANGTHADSAVATDDLIPPALDISLSIKLDKEPKALVLQPQGRELSYEYKDGRAYTTVERLDIHSVIQVMPCKA